MATEPYLGEIMMFAGTYAPRGWALCNGQLLTIFSNEALFSILGTIYGGDGRSTFGLPDLRGRAPIHVGQGPGLSNYRQGTKSGTETVTLSTAQLPSHSHYLQGSSSIPNQGSTENGALPTGTPTRTGGLRSLYTSQSPDKTMHIDNITATGGGQSINNLSPFLAINFCIALEGVFPPRAS